jgi:hypothetical protein
MRLRYWRKQRNLRHWVRWSCRMEDDVRVLGETLDVRALDNSRPAIPYFCHAAKACNASGSESASVKKLKKPVWDITVQISGETPTNTIWPFERQFHG